MKTDANRLKVLEISVRAAEKLISGDQEERNVARTTLIEIADQLGELSAAADQSTEGRRVGMRVDPRGMARVLRDAARKIASTTRAHADELDDIRLVASALENVIEPGPS